MIEVTKGLIAQGHPVSVMSDVELQQSCRVDGLAYRQIKSVANPVWAPNKALNQALCEINADVVLWHVGLAAFLYQSYPVHNNRLAAGIFTSPIYDLAELRQVGLGRLLRNLSISAVHLATALAPVGLLRRCVRTSSLRNLLVQTQTLKLRLTGRGLWNGPLAVIPPGVDPLWSRPPERGRAETRQQLGYDESKQVVLYFGSPAALRGLPTLIQAIPAARQSMPGLELLVLSRRHPGELDADAAALDAMIQASPARQHIRQMDGILPPQAVAAYVAACDVVALPFVLVPSDAPLSLLEANAAGRPVVTTRLACLPELVPAEMRYLAEPGDPVSLARQLCEAANHVFDEPADRPPARSWEQVGKEWSEWVQCLS